jgi:hypothetical protein
MLRRTILLCTMLAFPWSAWPQALPSIMTLQSQAAVTGEALSIGSVTLRLGMPKATALSELRKHYNLQLTTPSATWLEDWDIRNEVRDDEILGEVRFRSGILTFASKEWAPGEKEYSGADVAEMIYKLASQFEREGDVKCTIRTFSSLPHAGPGGLEFRKTEITCGHRQIDVMLIWQSGPARMQVTESIAYESEMIP